ncbi:MAG: hypothetical protein ACFFCD_02320 [Promethearchaeota archaeon]
MENFKITEIPKERQPFWQQSLDLQLRVEIPTETAIEVADEVILESTLEIPMETIRSMILDSLRKQDNLAVEKLTKRVERAKYIMNESLKSEVSSGGEIYDELASDKLLEDDEITAAELYFIEGRERCSWQHKKMHYDTKSTETTSEEYYDD